MKKFLTLILIAGLLTAALAVPVAATSVGNGDSMCTMSYDCPHTGVQHMAGCPMIPCTSTVDCPHGGQNHAANCPVGQTDFEPSVSPSEPSVALHDIWLYVYTNSNIIQPDKRVLLNNYPIVDDHTLTKDEIMYVVTDYYAATNANAGISVKGVYMETVNNTAMDFVAGMDEAPFLNLDEARAQNTVVIKVWITGVTNLPEEIPEIPVMPVVYMDVTDVWGAPGDTVTVTLEIDEVTASSVGVKYSLPEGIEFVSGQWLLEDSLLENAAGFGAAFAWSEARTISGSVLELTLQIREGAPMQGSIPFQVVLKDVDTTVCTATLSSSVQVDYAINIFGIDCSSINLSVGGTRTVGVQVDPEILADQVVWSSSDPSVAEVNDGVVTGIGPGTATITAQLGDWPQQCTVQVFESNDSGTKPCMITGEPGCVRHIRCIINSLLG